jgi:pimeloyl-ACP methyl ester carboxylesterase
MRAPRLLFPLFVAAAPVRAHREVGAALPEWGDQTRFAVASLRRFLREPVSPSRMTRRLAWIESHRFADPRAIQAPTLLLTGEPALDRIVPVAVTRRYLTQIPGSRHIVLDRTGHLGVITQPQRFADVVTAFVSNHAQAEGHGLRHSA